MNRGLRAAVLATVLAATLTVASSAAGGQVTAVYPDVMGCEAGCRVAAGGAPFRFLVDNLAISPVGSVSAWSLVTREDRVLWGPLLASFACWLSGSLVGLWAVKRRA